MTHRTQLAFRLSGLTEAMRERGRRADLGVIARQDLRRYYWLLAIALESAPPIPAALWATLLGRARAALAQRNSQGDLSACVFAAVDLLPIGRLHGAGGWTALQLLALADRMESTVRLRGADALPALAEEGVVKVSQGG